MSNGAEAKACAKSSSVVELSSRKSDLQPSKHEERDGAEAHVIYEKLPRRAGRLTIPIVLVLAIGALERAAFYAIAAPWQNYLQNPASDRSPPGALGLGQARATAINNAYLVFSSLTPLPLALAADLHLGRFKTLLISLSLIALGCVTQLITSIPYLIRLNAGPAGLAVSMILVGIGTGGVRAVFPPFLGDQCRDPQSRIWTRTDGKLELIDHRLTLQYIYNVYYGVINVACLSIVPSTFLEKSCGFWAAFSFATASIGLALILLITTSASLEKVLPGENILVPATKVLACAMRNGFDLQRAKSSYQISTYGRTPAYTDSFVEEVQMTMHTCRILLSFAIFYLCANQMSNNLVSQAGQMQLSGVPNDMVPTFASVACVILAPMLQALWNFLARRNIVFRAVTLIESAFILCAAALGFAALTQHLIYQSPPCFDRPKACRPTAEPNEISVWVQIPSYIIAALAETIGFVTASEYAYSHSPQNAKSMIQAFSQLAAALGSLLGLAVSPAARDPWLVIYYGALAGGMIAAAGMFWWLFGKDEEPREGGNTSS